MIKATDKVAEAAGLPADEEAAAVKMQAIQRGNSSRAKIAKEKAAPEPAAEEAMPEKPPDDVADVAEEEVGAEE